MTTTTQNTQVLMKKIQSLPVDRIAEVEDFVDFIKERARLRQTPPISKQLPNFPVDDLGIWPKGLSLSREGIYGDDGR